MLDLVFFKPKYCLDHVSSCYWSFAVSNGVCVYSTLFCDLKKHIFETLQRRKNRIKSAFIDDEAEDTNDGADGDEAKDDGVQNVANDEDSEFNFGKNIGRRDQVHVLTFVVDVLQLSEGI